MIMPVVNTTLTVEGLKYRFPHLKNLIIIVTCYKFLEWQKAYVVANNGFPGEEPYYLGHRIDPETGQVDWGRKYRIHEADIS